MNTQHLINRSEVAFNDRPGRHLVDTHLTRGIGHVPVAIEATELLFQRQQERSANVDNEFLIFRAEYERLHLRNQRTQPPAPTALFDDMGVPAGARVEALFFGVVTIGTLALIGIAATVSRAWGG